MAEFLPELKPGDVLLFNRSGTFNWIIRVKTWSRFSHVEVAVGPERLFASRNGEGVNFYRLDARGLAVVLRPREPFDVRAAEHWARFSNVVGQGYDWAGLLNFTYARLASRENGRMFCSEAATRFLRMGGLDPFPGADADTIAPRDFSMCPLFVPVWKSADEHKRAEVI
jgi:hypothetical protein